MTELASKLRALQERRSELLRRAVTSGGSPDEAVEMSRVVSDYDGLLLEAALSVGVSVEPKGPSGKHQFFSSGERLDLENRLAAAGLEVGHIWV